MKTPLTLFILFISFSLFAQRLTHVTLARATTLTSFAFTTDQQIIIKVSPDGKILEWGEEAGTGRYYNEPGKLQPYMGRVEYYGTQYDSAFAGKVKSIGTCNLTYYGSFETAALVGKVKTIGSVLLDYYNEFENEAYRGKLKTASSTMFSYYSSYDNELFRGKLKSLRSNELVYYSSFDDPLLRGKIKSIGNFQFAWYTSFDRKEYRGSLKSGRYDQMIDGVMYIIR